MTVRPQGRLQQSNDGLNVGPNKMTALVKILDCDSISRLPEDRGVLALSVCSGTE